MSEFSIQYAWLIPLFPFAGFLCNLAFGARLQKKAFIPPVAAMALSLLLSTGCFIATLSHDFTGEQGHRQLNWLTVRGVDITMGYQIDPLSAMMLMVVTFIGGLIFIYSIGYMEKDPRFHRFFAYLSLFACAMLTLVLADNFILLFTGWEGVGLCSYFLIGFWFEKASASKAAKKAFLITRIGDVGMGLGIYLLYAYTGHFDFHGIFEFVHEHGPQMAGGVLLLAMLLVFVGPIGKSAQFPLHIWLPDAMEGPTPVSALIHAATMVAAGVYLVARLFPLYASAATYGHGMSDALTAVGITGGLTAVLAATIAVAANDIKKVLAYSTISQLGFMIAAMGCGVGGYIAGVFHLMTHAFFKALLFLGSGSVIHGMEHGMHGAHIHADPQDMWNMGGLGKFMPHTKRVYWIGAAALSGFPFLAGFWSKDEILHHALEHQMPIAIMLGFGAFLTAFYMTRQWYLVFGGEIRDHRIHPHESPMVMVAPLYILAFFSVVIGFAVGPTHLFAEWMKRTLEFAPGGEELAHALHAPESFLHTLQAATVPMAISVAVASAGFLLGRAIYGKPIADEAKDPIRKLGGLHRALVNLWYLDFYEAMYPLGQAVRKVYFAVTGALFRFDSRVIDGTVNLVGIATMIMARIDQLFDLYLVDGTVNLVGWATKAWGSALRRVQTGVAQNYMLVVVLGVLMLIALSRL